MRPGRRGGLAGLRGENEAMRSGMAGLREENDATKARLARVEEALATLAAQGR